MASENDNDFITSGAKSSGQGCRELWEGTSLFFHGIYFVLWGSQRWIRGVGHACKCSAEQWCAGATGNNINYFDFGTPAEPNHSTNPQKKEESREEAKKEEHPTLNGEPASEDDRDRDSEREVPPECSSDEHDALASTDEDLDL